MLLAADAPNVADWIAAIGQAAGALFTAAAVGVAVWLGWRDRKWRRADQAATAVERADRDAAQARLVTITYDVTSDRTVQVTIKNESASPIFNASGLDEVEGDDPAYRWQYDWDEIARMDSGGVFVYVLSAGELFGYAGTLIRDDGERLDVGPGTPVRPSVTFTDSNGLRWARRGTGAPIRLIDGECRREPAG